jgi:enoyl-CoA hydratase
MDIERKGAVALLRMKAGKANAISLGWLEKMGTLLDALEAAPPRALILTGDGRAFCAGLDLPSLVDLGSGDMTAFIHRFSDTMVRIFALPWPVVAAVNGHAVAGGCVLALQADQRLMASGGGRIGLNEVQLGIGLPVAVVETLRCQVPPATLFPVAAEGGLFAAEEALRLGLVDEVVEAGRLEARAWERATALAALPQLAFARVKASLRGPVLAAIREASAADARAWTETFHSPDAQRLLRDVVTRLTQRAPS